MSLREIKMMEYYIYPTKKYVRLSHALISLNKQIISGEKYQEAPE